MPFRRESRPGGGCLRAALLGGGLLLIPCLLCRLSQPAADFYAGHVYPQLSRVLTLAASAVPFSLTECAVLLWLAILLVLPLWCLAGKMRARRMMLLEVVLILWAYDWFYLAWGNNYFRSSIYARSHQEVRPYEAEAFTAFLEDYTEGLRECLRGDLSVPSSGELLGEIRTAYLERAPKSCLAPPRSYQEPKQLLLGRVYSGAGVLGYLGPFFDEFHVNPDADALEYPFCLAHEYAHVLGVSEEAEANYWAYEVLKDSGSALLRYSALMGIFSSVWQSARGLLDSEAFERWRQAIPGEAMADIQERQARWDDLRWPILDRIQSRVYDLFLRGNTVRGGMKNYAQVVGMIISLDRARRDGRAEKAAVNRQGSPAALSGEDSSSVQTAGGTK